MRALAASVERIKICLRRVLNLRFALRRVKNIKNVILEHLHTLLNLQRELSADTQKLKQEHTVLSAEIEVLRSTQQTLLQAAVYSIEIREQQHQQLVGQHAQVLRHLEILAKQVEHLNHERLRHTRQIEGISSCN